jgi:hypothetical protein
MFVGPIINLFIGGTIIYYLQYLENIDCKCSLTFQRNYIYYYTITIFIFNLISIFFQDKLKNLNFKFLLFLPIVIVIAGIINIVYTIEYVNDMKKQNCQCSESFIRDLMFIIAILQISAFVIVIITMTTIIGLKIDVNKYILNSKSFSLLRKMKI